MSVESLSAEDIEANFNKFRQFCSMLGDRSEAAVSLVDNLGERLALCPASGRSDYHNAFPGGLVEHSLRVLLNAKRLATAFSWDLPKSSLIIGSLFHDLGKVGSPTGDYYVPQNDSWRVKNLGEVYLHNTKIEYMSVPDRGLFLCQHFGLKLTHDETLAIKLNDGFILDENKKYCLKTPLLAYAVMTADYIATCQEKDIFPM